MKIVRKEYTFLQDTNGVGKGGGSSKALCSLPPEQALVLYQSFFYIQGMNPLDATGIPETEQS